MRLPFPLEQVFAKFRAKPSDENGCRLLSPEEFTNQVAETFRSEHGDLNVEVVRELELKIGGSFTSMLNNGYNHYRLEPGDFPGIVADVMANALDSIKRSGSVADPAQIVPVIKTRSWLEESVSIFRHERPDFPTPYHEEYNEELLILYAEDTEHGIRYLNDSELDRAGVEREGLRDLAVANLARILPPLESPLRARVYFLTADEVYESSLILFGWLWNAENWETPGEIVVALPVRQMLMVTGSEDMKGLATMRRLARDILGLDCPYQLTASLFVYRGGRFEKFE